VRRFIASLTGKVFSQLVILALLLPSITLALLSRAEAQVAVLPTWTVVEFRNRKSPGTTFGKVAQTAVMNELGKTNQYDITPEDTVNRAISDLGISSPPEGTINLLRVAQAAQSSTIVAGDILDYRIINSGSGKQAVAQLSVVVYDVASGVPINGSVQGGRSTIRPNDVADELLITDAINQAASQAIRDIQTRNLPTATVLNTLTNSALLNKGTRSGFTVGQEVIVLRGREQVATGRISDVEPDNSTLHIEKSSKGIQPGDKVRAIWSPPDVKLARPIDDKGDVRVIRPSRNHGNTGIIQVALIVGLIAVLLGNGNASGQNVTREVRAEPLLYPGIGGQPAVRISWSSTGFAGGNSTRHAWQVWRNDVQEAPVVVAPGTANSAYDFNTPRTTVTYTNLGTIGGTTCNGTVDNASFGPVPGISAGRPYVYSVELVYQLSALDLPDGGSTGQSGTGTTAGGNNGSTAGGNTGTTAGGNTGTTAGGNTGTTAGGNTGTTAGGNTGTTAGGNTGNTAGNLVCYFESARQTAIGTATPLNPPALASPGNGVAVTTAPFSFDSVVTGLAGITVEYVVQFSDTPTFSRSTIVARFTSNLTGRIQTPTSIDTTRNVPSYVANASTVYWRVGAKNVADRPGPVPDPLTKQRYIFSQYRTFVRPGTPPPPPAY